MGLDQKVKALEEKRKGEMVGFYGYNAFKVHGNIVCEMSERVGVLKPTFCVVSADKCRCGDSIERFHQVCGLVDPTYVTSILLAATSAAQMIIILRFGFVSMKKTNVSFLLDVTTWRCLQCIYLKVAERSFQFISGGCIKIQRVRCMPQLRQYLHLDPVSTRTVSMT